MKIVSLIIPSYNMELYLQRSIDSIVAATNVDKTEIIIINDGSKDHTLDIANEYQNKFPDIVKVIDKPNGHYGSCLNVGLKEAQGKYFRILDADDEMDTKELEKFIEALQKTDADLVITHRLEVLPISKDKKLVNRLLFSTFPYYKELPASELSFENLEYPTSMHSMTFKTDILRQCGVVFPEGICYTDTIYDAIPLGRIKTFIVFNMFPYIYYVAQEGSSTTLVSVKNNLKDISIVLLDLLQYVQNSSNVLPNIRVCQLVFVKQALSLFVRSLRMNYLLDKHNAELVANVIKGCKDTGLDDKMFHKYYFHPLVSHPHPSLVNVCLILYHILHPFKKVH